MMKKNIFLIVNLLFLLCAYVSAQVFVTESEAIVVASKYMQYYFNEKTYHTKEVSHVDSMIQKGHVLLYEVCYKNGCSALISGVKSVKPILGYNINGDSVSFLHSGGMNVLSFFVGKYAK